MKYNAIQIFPHSWTNIEEKIFFFDCPELNLDSEKPFIPIETFGGEKEDFTPKFWIVYHQKLNFWITFTVIVNSLHIRDQENEDIKLEFLGFLGKFKQETIDAIFEELSSKKRSLKSTGIIYINADLDNALWMDCPICKGLDDDCPHCYQGRISFCGIECKTS